MNKINVVAAIIIKEEKVFCVQRNSKGEAALKWEFPGGKVEFNESEERALVREVKEELSCDISIDEFFMTVEYQYKTFYLTMHCYKCTLISDRIALNEHIDSCWLPVSKLNTLDWAPADLPIVRKIESRE